MGNPDSPRVAGSSRDRTLGFSILGASFLGALALSWVASERVKPELPRAPKAPTADGISGFPDSVSATLSLDRARSSTARTELLGIVVKQVNSDGTIDLSRPGNQIRYAFRGKPGEGPQPTAEFLEANKKDKNVSFCGRQDVIVDHRGMAAKKDRTNNPCLPKQLEALPTPECGAKEVWAKAIEKGWPTDKPAKLEYYRSMAGPAWRLTLKGAHQTLTLYGDCQKELSGKESQGLVPW